MDIYGARTASMAASLLLALIARNGAPLVAGASAAPGAGPGGGDSASRISGGISPARPHTRTVG
jgi:hypothetical protein